MAITTLEDTINRQTHSRLGMLLTKQTFWVFVASVIAFIGLKVDQPAVTMLMRFYLETAGVKAPFTVKRHEAA